MIRNMIVFDGNPWWLMSTWSIRPVRRDGSMQYLNTLFFNVFLFFLSCHCFSRDDEKIKVRESLSHNLILLLSCACSHLDFNVITSYLNLETETGLLVVLSRNETSGQRRQLMKFGIKHKLSMFKWSFVPLAPSFITISSQSKINFNFSEDSQPQISLHGIHEHIFISAQRGITIFTLFYSTSDTCWEGEESGWVSYPGQMLWVI